MRALWKCCKWEFLQSELAGPGGILVLIFGLAYGWNAARSWNGNGVPVILSALLVFCTVLAVCRAMQWPYSGAFALERTSGRAAWQSIGGRVLCWALVLAGLLPEVHGADRHNLAQAVCRRGGPGDAPGALDRMEGVPLDLGDEPGGLYTGPHHSADRQKRRQPAPGEPGAGSRQCGCRDWDGLVHLVDISPTAAPGGRGSGADRPAPEWLAAGEKGGMTEKIRARRARIFYAQARSSTVSVSRNSREMHQSAARPTRV